MNYFYQQLLNFPWFQQLCIDRQIVLIDMCFMGWKRFLEFKDMLTALEFADYQEASFQMMNSEWAGQVGDRARTLSKAMRTGIYNV